ncbi:hypothetical protein ACH4TX_45115 [Streptomyces sp. NPDC021098]|uniref:hypothetical protein n=1 Tax=unclassified Streptomyces TaxID=2593676 RepID=UPI0037AE4BF3
MEPANQVFWKGRDLRDLVATGATTDDPAFGTHVRDYLAAAEAAQTAMRRDLGTAPWPQHGEEATAPHTG